MGQNQRDGGWQGQSNDRIEPVLRAIDSHSRQESYAAEPDRRAAWNPNRAAAVSGKESLRHALIQANKRRGRRTHRIKLNKTAFPKRTAAKRTWKEGEQNTEKLIKKGIVRFKEIGSKTAGNKTTNNKTGGSRRGRGGIKVAVAAACFLSLFFAGRGIGYVTEGTVPTSAELLAQTDNWGLGFGAEGAQPAGNVSASELAQYDAWYVGDAKEKVIYLTFDAGYENGNTEPILDALKKHHASATFFVVGHYLETAPELIKRMVAEGHTVGNHTWHHPDMSSISSKETFSEEMSMVEAKYKELTGEEMVKFYRPPQGKYNLDNLKMAQELGYQTFFWSLAYVDWYQEKQPSHEEAFEKLTKRIHPGAIVLLHSTSKTNGEILDELLTKWEGMGYTFRPLSALAKEEKPTGSPASSDGTIEIYSGKEESKKKESDTGDGTITQ